jgi:hypothetical protein
MNLDQFTTEQLQQIASKLSIQTINQHQVMTAAHKLYWDQLWPQKLRITDGLGKRLLENTQYTGLALTAAVNQLNPRLVLDIGCGQNFYKDKIQNLVGIDPYGPDADISADYFSGVYGEIADVILVLGVLEYGSRQTVIDKLQFMHRNCHAETQVFFRFNISPRFEHEILPDYDICYFMDKLVQTPAEWNSTVEEAGYQILHSDWDTLGQRWHIRAKLK